MNQPIEVKCPNCGASAGSPASNGEYRCAFCNHVSRAAPADRRSPERMAALATAMQGFAASRQASTEIEQRLRAKERSSTGTFLVILLVVGTVLTLAGVGLVIVGLQGSTPAFVPAVPAGLLGGIFLFLAIYNLRDRAREDRLRSGGVRGRATIDSYREKGNHTFQLVLHVELPSRPPYDVRTKQYVGSNWVKITTHAELPVFVNPDDPNDLMFAFDD